MGKEIIPNIIIKGIKEKHRDEILKKLEGISKKGKKTMLEKIAKFFRKEGYKICRFYINYDKNMEIELIPMD